MEEVRAILFDVGNVLVTFEDRRNVVGRIVTSFRKNGNGGAEDIRFDGVWGTSVFNELDTGKMSHRALWQLVYRAAEVSPKELPCHRFTCIYVEHWKPVLETIALVQSLQEHYLLVAVSDGDFGSTYALDILRVHYGIKFLETFVSYEHGCKKPILYEKTLEVLADRYGVLADACVCVDDIPLYVEVAQKMGMRGILFDASNTPADTLTDSLLRTGVKV